MKRLWSVFVAVAVGVISTANAWHICGRVVCLSDSQEITPLENVLVMVTNSNGFSESAFTDATGLYCIRLLDTPESYVAFVVPESLPKSVNSPNPILPASGFLAFTLTSTFVQVDDGNFVFACGAACWLTGGGVKFEPVVGLRLAEGGPADTIGGNVFPGCSPTAGDGGQWNHVAHSDKLHFQGWAVQVVRCGNVTGIPPGSESPETPFNYIEFVGTGTVKGIKGNKIDPIDVFFFARCEDRNEPGSSGAKAGALIDRYFLHVWDASGHTVLLFDEDGDPQTVDPVTITGGNLQIHISSCP